MGLFSLFGQPITLYFPGTTTYFKFPEKFQLYQKIFDKLGIRFNIFNMQISSGLSALEAGYESSARKLAKKNFELFKQEKIKEIITNSPEDYRMFLENYPNLLPDWDIKINNLWEIILDKLESKPYLIENKVREIVSYHDSCSLGRYCGIYEEPRKILKLIGYELREMSDSKNESFCCGSCGGLPRTNPQLADEIARERILQAKRIGVKKIIVASMENYQLLKKNSVDSNIDILELCDVLALALGISEKEKSKEEQILLEVKAQEKLNEELKNEPGKVVEDENE